MACTNAPAADMVTAVKGAAEADAAEGMHGFPVALTSFVGRAQAVADVVGRLNQGRLVTVTGLPGLVISQLAFQGPNKAGRTPSWSEPATTGTSRRR